MNFTPDQAAQIAKTLKAFALKNGATERDLLESQVTLGQGDALRRHIQRVERVLRCSYAAIPQMTKNVLECCRYVAGALASTVECYEWDQLDRRVWRVAMSAI